MLVYDATPSDDCRLSYFFELTDHALRRQIEADQGIFIAESIKVIRTACEQGIRPLAFLLEERRLPAARAILERYPDVPAFILGREELSKLVGYPHNRGMLAAMERPAPKSLASVLEGAQTLAVLEAITDTTNVGAIFRSAAAMGVDGLLLSPTCADPLTRRAVRVSMASVFLVPWARLDAWPESLVELKAAGFTTCACALSDDALELGDPQLKVPDKLALLFGTEGDGLSKRTIAAADMLAKIPMSHAVDSLNVAAASAVFFWELARR